MTKLNAIPPALIFYTDNLPTGVGGCAQGPIVRAREKYREDKGIHAHELEHVKQGWFTLFIGHALLYLFVRRYRLWAEAKAYRQQMKYPNSKGEFLTLDDAAAKLAGPRYNLGITVEQARETIGEIEAVTW